MTLETLQTGTATVSGDATFDDGPWTVHGVAQASEVTQGVSGKRRFWPSEVLRDAVEKLESTPLVSPDDHEDLTQGQPDPTTIIGEVTDAAFDETRAALVYQAEIDDPEFAKLAARGRIDVSPSVALRAGDRDEERDAQRVAEVLEYRDLAAVTEGAHPSASINLGTAEALSRQFGVSVDALQRQQARTPAYRGTEDSEWSTPTLVDYLRNYDTLPAPDEVNSVGDLTQDQRSLIASKSLLGTPSGETLREVRFFPVVEPSTDALNRRALGAVRSGRGEQAEIPDDALANAQQRAGELLVEEFDSDIDIETMADVSELAEGRLVRWPSTGDRPAYGMIDEVRTDGEPALDEAINGEQRVTSPAALIEVHRPDGDGGWQPSGTMVGHKPDTLTIIDDLPDPESLANSWGGDDGPDGGMGQSTPATDWRTIMSDNLTDKERELLAAAGQKDDPVVVEAGVRERLSEHDELLDDAESTEDPVVVESTNYDALQERVSEVRDVLSEALQERTGLSDAAIKAMPFEALAAEFETDDGDLDVEALTQSPETGSGPSGDGGTDGPTDEDLERLGEIKTKLDTVGDALPDSRVEALREEATSLAETDDYAAAMEVL